MSKKVEGNRNSMRKKQKIQKKEKTQVKLVQLKKPVFNMKYTLDEISSIIRHWLKKLQKT